MGLVLYTSTNTTNAWADNSLALAYGHRYLSLNKDYLPVLLRRIVCYNGSPPTVWLC